MRRKVLLPVILSAAMLLGASSSAYPALAAGQMPSNDVTAGMESSVSDSMDDAESEQTYQDDGVVNSEKESTDASEPTEEKDAGAEAEPEETIIEEEVIDKEGTVTEAEEAPVDESTTEPVIEEEEKPENLVGASADRKSVGENVTAEFDSDTGTVTFYSQGGTLAKDWAKKAYINWDERTTIKVITISSDSDVMYLPQDSSYLFGDFHGLQSLNLSKADTSIATDMTGMFAYCRSLQNLDISAFDMSNVTNMKGMFEGCSSLQTLDLSGFNTSNVTNMSSMFRFCSSLQTLNIRGLDTSNVTNMRWMFGDCSGLQTLDVSGFNTSNVSDMGAMFDNCSSLQFLDISGFNTSNVTYMGAMFDSCSSLQTVDVSGFNTSNVTDMARMFIDCSSLQVLDVSGFDTSNVLYMTKMFGNCSELQILNVSKFTTSNVEMMAEMFSNCSSLQTLDVSGFDTSNVGSIYGMFSGCSNLRELDVSNFDVSKIWATSIITGSPSVAGCDKFFDGCSSLQQLDLSSFDMDRIDTAKSMINCDNLLVIQTPVNLHLTVELPGTYVDTSGKEYYNLPEGLAESIRLTKKSSDRPALISIADATVTGISNKTYTGTAQTQNLTVKMGDKTLVAGTDYTLSYANNTNAGTATVTITGKGNYTGTVSKNFTINKAAPKLVFASAAISKKTQDTAFTNTLTKTTDGTVTFKSSNTNVATVNSTTGKVTIKGAGTAIITATAAAGTNYKAGSAKYTLTVMEALKIVSVSDDFYGKTGTQASFHVEAVGAGTISYQWQYRTAGMSNWKSPAQASAKTADYVFNLKPSYDNIEVRCIVSDESGNQTITENRKANVFAYTSQPKDVTASDNEAVNFEVSAIGRGVTYQWYYMRPNGAWKKTTVSGSNTAILPITAGTKNDGTSYRCVITDEQGNQITSTAGTLTLEAILRITNISDNVYDQKGENATFHIDAVGKGTLSYQWQYKLAGESRWRTPGQASAKTADYVFKLIPSYDNIEVRCIVTDAAGNTCTSDIRKANVFAVTKQPTTVFAELGDKVTFAVEGIGQNLTYQWYYRRLDGDWKKVTAAGYNTASLTITAQVKNNGSQYRCYVYDGVGNLIKSRAAMLIERNEEYEG